MQDGGSGGCVPGIVKALRVQKPGAVRSAVSTSPTSLSAVTAVQILVECMLYDVSLPSGPVPDHI